MTVASLSVWIALPNYFVTGLALIAAAAMQAARLARWAGDRTTPDRLVLVLHVGYAFVPLGLALLGASNINPSLVPRSAGIHAWSAGAIGMMTLAVMARASLGHTGRPLSAGTGTQAIYLFAFVATMLRIIAAFNGSAMFLELATAAWVAAFCGFVILYGPLLAKEKPIWAGRG
jgi:uncharacterized protein involved in response to NO